MAGGVGFEEAAGAVVVDDNVVARAVGCGDRRHVVAGYLWQRIVRVRGGVEIGDAVGWWADVVFRRTPRRNRDSSRC